MITITFPDGNKKQFQKGTTSEEIAKSISEGLLRISIASKINGELKDLNEPIQNDSKIEIITQKSKESLEILRHTTAHIFAQALLRLYPKAQITIGPAIENGFYYDIDLDTLTDEDLPKIEQEMQKIIKEDIKITSSYKTKKEALNFFKNNKYKQEIIKELKGDKLKFYKQGEFIDICTGPHLPSTGMIKAFKLEKVTKAYWRGDAKNKQLTRVYGTAFWKKTDLDAHFQLLEEAKKRDHRLIGKQMDLFSFHEEAPGIPFYHPKGTIIYNELQNYCRDLNTKYKYNEIKTPTILHQNLWKTSGHWDHFKENMYFTEIDKKQYAIKPMNCPGGLLIYKNHHYSYKDLPIRNAEFGLVHRHELSGALSGLFRVRAFTQDDAHVFCTEEQIEKEIIQMIEYAIEVYSTFNFQEYEWFVATKPENAMGDEKIWEKATNALINALKRKKLPYQIKEGEGAFYGPKIEINLKDTIGRRWQCGTIQIDFSMTKKFNAVYETKDSKKQTPVMIHRAILGSLERFIGILIEHFAGKFPLWISPTQIKIINVADRHIEYCEKIKQKLQEKKFRVETNYEHQTVSNKIRLAQSERINYIIVIGDKDLEEGTIAVRDKSGKTTTYKTEDFIKQIEKEKETKEIK